MIYGLIILLLLLAENLYFFVAKRYKILDIPNTRSSHNHNTIRGGGIIYWIAALLYVVFNPSLMSAYFFVGMTLMSGISFLDDIKPMGQKIRLLFHFLGITISFCIVNAFDVYSWWIILPAYIICVGIINAYNFMDGINGMTGLNTIAVLLSMMYVNCYIYPFVESDLLYYPLIASIIFLFFNFRKNAKCFAGDVGSVGIAFWVVTLLLLLIVKTQNLIWIGFLMVYGVETICTILHRIYLKQNIMKPHRLHFFQILVNEQKIGHRTVSLIYFFTQVVCSILIIVFYSIIGWWIFILLGLILVGLYSLKFKLINVSSS